MTHPTIRVGIIGCGEIAQLMHLPFLAELHDFEVTAICDLSEQVLEGVGEQFGVARRYTDMHQLTSDPEVDVVVICTYDHVEAAVSALKNRKHILVEKPLAFTPFEAREIERLAQEAGVVASIGYMKLFDEGFKAALKKLAEVDYLRSATVHDYAGRFDLYGAMYSQHRGSDVPGELLAAGRETVKRKVESALGAEHAGYADLYLTLLMLGSHDLAVMRALFGATLSVKYATQTEESSVLAVLELEKVGSCVFELGFGAQYEWWDEFVAGYGINNSFRLDFSNPYLRQSPATLTWRHGEGANAVASTIEPLQHSAFRNEWLHFAECLRGEIENGSPLGGGVQDLDTALAIIHALPGKPVSS